MCDGPVGRRAECITMCPPAPPWHRLFSHYPHQQLISSWLYLDKVILSNSLICDRVINYWDQFHGSSRYRLIINTNETFTSRGNVRTKKRVPLQHGLDISVINANFMLQLSTKTQIAFTARLNFTQTSHCLWRVLSQHSHRMYPIIDDAITRGHCNGRLRCTRRELFNSVWPKTLWSITMHLKPKRGLKSKKKNTEKQKYYMDYGVLACNVLLRPGIPTKMQWHRLLYALSLFSCTNASNRYFSMNHA